MTMVLEAPTRGQQTLTNVEVLVGEPYKQIDS